MIVAVPQPRDRIIHSMVMDGLTSIGGSGGLIMNDMMDIKERRLPSRRLKINGGLETAAP